MKAFKGAHERLEQETVLVWNCQEPEAVLWTADPRVYRALATAGYTPDVQDEYDGGRGSRFVLLKSHIRLPAGPEKAVSRPTGPTAAGSQAPKIEKTTRSMPKPSDGLETAVSGGSK